MGSAIECFDDADAVVVPRSRFAPVKTCNDLFALRSGARGRMLGFQRRPACSCFMQQPVCAAVGCAGLIAGWVGWLAVNGLSALRSGARGWLLGLDAGRAK